MTNGSGKCWNHSSMRRTLAAEDTHSASATGSGMQMPNVAFMQHVSYVLHFDDGLVG
jgi:hypothetical protein